MSNKIKTILKSDKELNTNSEDFYKDYWSGSNEIRSYTHEKNKIIIQRILKFIPSNKKLLEVGIGGEGGILLQLKNNNEVFGVDVSDSAISNCNKFGIKVFKKNLDIDKLNEFEDNYFDIIFAFEVFEHFSNPQHAIEEIRRVLKPGGVLLISTPSQYTYHWPRLFYYDLFSIENFTDFLMINEFYPESSLDPYTINAYQNSKIKVEKQAWSYYFLSYKLGDDDAEKYFELGKRFWNKLDSEGIRLRPIESIDLFRKAHKLSKGNIEYKLIYTLSLVYRARYNDADEFNLLLKELFENKSFTNESEQALFTYYLLLTAVEYKKLGGNIISDAEMNSVLESFKNQRISDDKRNSLSKEIEALKNILL